MTYPSTVPSASGLWAVIECPLGQGVRTRLDAQRRPVPVRTLPPGVFYPYNYGFVENTLVEDGDELDVFVLGPSARAGSRIEVVLLGAVEFTDPRGDDPKLIAAPAGTVPDEALLEVAQRIGRFLRDYKSASEPRTVGDLLGIEAAADILRGAQARFLSGAR